jgi:hypothetical protein
MSNGTWNIKLFSFQYTRIPIFKKDKNEFIIVTLNRKVRPATKQICLSTLLNLNKANEVMKSALSSKSDKTCLIFFALDCTTVCKNINYYNLVFNIFF